MAVSMVERELPAITMEQLAAAQQAAIKTGAEMSGAGTPVRYIRTTFVPGENRCLCLVEAESPEPVKQLNDRAGIPYTPVVEALDLTPAPR